jgi:D-serine deaminase-like pyridoxal phosphate-dependent protein
VLSSWRRKDDADAASRLVVERISQEHAIVAWEDDKRNIPLEIGQVVKVFPNHSCVTGAFYGWYFVVDSDEDPSASTIVDVWIRGRGESTDPLLATRFQ